MEIEGFSHGTILHLISEVGLEGIKSFKPPNSLPAGWLAQTIKNGGKIISSKVPKGSNRLKNCSKKCRLCRESERLHSTKRFLPKKSSSKGGVTLVQLLENGVIVWNMVTKGTRYINPRLFILRSKRKLGWSKESKNKLINLD
ncbi:MAG: hypothetical protein IPQ23_04495 [Cytophagaceae bacterium]|nr:hypothetical protein [Cytophagaceae bacterium]